jgi:protein TonB
VLAVAESAPVPAPPTVAPPPVEQATPSLEPADVPAEASPGPPPRSSLDSLSGNPDDMRKYIAAIMRQLNRHKTYARELKKAKIEGTVLIQFTIDREGRLLASGVKQTSGHAELDRAAMDMLARANPLPAIPDFMNRDELALAIPVEYSLITDR